MRRTVIAGLLIGAACGSATETGVRTRSGPTSFEGKYATFLMYDAIVDEIGANLEDGGTMLRGPIGVTAFDLDIQDAPWSCWEPDAGPPPKDVARVIWSMSRLKPTAFPTGDYAVGAAPGLDPIEWSAGIYLDWRPDCLAQQSALTGGKLSVSSLTGEEAQGWISVTLEDGTLLEGEFIARRCPAVFSPPPDGGYVVLPRCGG